MNRNKNLTILVTLIFVTIVTINCDLNQTNRKAVHTNESIKEFASRLDSIRATALKTGHLTPAIDTIHHLTSEELYNFSKIKAKSYSILGEFHARTQNLDSGKYYLFEAINLQILDKDTANIINTTNNIGNIFMYQDSFGKAIQSYNMAFKWGARLNDTVKMIRAHSNMASAYISLDLAGEAITILKDSRTLAKSSKSSEFSILSSLGRAYNKLGSAYTDSVYYFYSKALTAAKNENDKRQLIIGRLNAATAAWKIEGREKAAIESLEKIKEDLNIKEYKQQYYHILNSLIKANIRINNPIKVKEYLKQYKEFLKYPLKNIPDKEKYLILDAEIFVERSLGRSQKLLELVDSSRTVNKRIYENRINTLSTSGNRQAYIKDLQFERKIAGDESAKTKLKLVRASNKLKNQLFLLIASLGILVLLGWLYRISRKSLSQVKIERAKVVKLNRELNHRAANQLSLAYELILDQRRQIGDEQAKASLQKSESQLMALREVNRALANKSDDLVRADQVLQKVAENLQSASPYPFKLDLQLDAITIHGNAASRSALILSELMSNSIKYAFPNQEDAKASLSLQQSDRGISMTYVDNGPGKDGRTRGTGVGSELIEAMLEDMDAEFEEIAGEDGTGYGLRWWWG